jgi:uncharacterized membrane protein YphA (DoxX/SURF4 family)
MGAKFKVAQPWLTLFARLILGGVLLAAGALKIGSLQKSAMAVRAYELLPVPSPIFLDIHCLGLKLGLDYFL